MDEIRPGLKAALEGKRGMNSRVISGGQIAVGDPITIVQQQELAS
jgi:MOSC domain-containing protein YiiM